MSQPKQDQFRTLFPHVKQEDLDAALERFKRYVALAAEVSMNGSTRAAEPLTESSTGVNVNAGQVDPSTLQNTG